MHECVFEFDCVHNQIGFSKLLKIIRKANNPTIYFEATGIYSKPIEKFCQDNSLRYALLNPLQVHLETAQLRRVKNDKADAHKIALSTYQNEYRIMAHQDPIYAEIRELSRFIDQIDQDINIKRSKLLGLLQQTFPEIENLFTNRMSKLALNVVQLFPHPVLVLELSRTKIKNVLIRETNKKLSKAKGLKYADKLLKYAKNSYPAVTQNSALIDEVKYFCRLLIELTEQKEKLVKQIEKLSDQLPEFAILESVPGIGAQTAAQLIGEMGNINRFDNANQLNAYVGIDINRYQSGNYTRTDHINKRGNPKLRKILYLTIKNMVRLQALGPNHIVDYYYKLKNGPTHKKDKVATVACMNKTVKCLFSMVQTNQQYDYTYHEL